MQTTCETCLLGIQSAQPHKAFGVLAASAAMTEKQQTIGIVGLVQKRWYAVIVESFLAHRNTLGLAAATSLSGDLKFEDGPARPEG